MLSTLLDEALDLDPADRDAWIERLGATRPDLAPKIQKLLAAHASTGASDVLAQLPAVGIAAATKIGVSGLVEGTLVGPYRLKREIGRGGMADLWLAERADGAFERDVALKLPRLTRLRRDLAARFAHERDILAQLEHPYIARFYDAGVTDDGLPFLAMEYVNGRRITQWCDEHTLDVAARLRLIGQVLEAVQFAHKNLIIHRDLKPSNILVTESGQVRLLDFGIAKLLAEGNVAQETQLTEFAGRALTPEYASPEQIRGNALTTATDVYSLAVVLYELLTGRLPYRLAMSSVAQLEEAIVNAVAVRPSVAAASEHARSCGSSEKRLKRALAGDLDTILLKALAKEPVQRYGSATELAQDLQRHLAGEPVRARPASWGYRARTFIRRNRLAVAAASAVSLALIAGAAVSLWQAQRARAQAELARQQAVRAEEVKSFVLGIFADADIDRGGSRSTTGLDLLRQARKRLAEAPVTDPSITVELLNSVGYGLVGLGEFVEAIAVLEQAAQMSAQRLGPDHLLTITANINLCEAYLDNGSVEKADRAIGLALAGARHNTNMKALVDALRWMGTVRVEQGNDTEALKYVNESVRFADTTPGIDNHDVLLAHWTEAEILWRGHAKGTLAAARRTYELARDYWGGRSTPDVLAARSFYAVVMGMQGDAQAAVRELRAVRAEQIRLFGGISYVDVVHTNARIGLASLSLGDPVAALASYREAIRGLEAQTGGGAPSDIAVDHMWVGASLLDARRFGEAEAELRQALAVLAPLHSPSAAETTRLLAAVLIHDRRLSEAAELLAPSLAQPPSAPVDLAKLKWRLGSLRSAQGRHQEALSLLRDAEDLFVKSGTPSQAAVALATLGAAQLAASRATQAIPTLQRGDMLLAKVHPNGSSDHADLLIDLARAQLALGHPVDAAAAAARADEFWSGFDARNRQAGLAALWHARALQAEGQAQQAAETWKRASAVLAKAALPADGSLLAQTRREFQAVPAAN
ncbi:MAG TPA: protein kinase [Steroidobacteraceae bacterium]|nr:protein kinase [Steroidobacteraceae bacterium]